MALVNPRFSLLFVALLVVFVLYGAALTIVGAVLPRIFAEFGWSYFDAGLIIAAGSIGSFSAAFAAGRLLRYLGCRTTVLIGLGLLCVGLLLFGVSRSVAVNFLLYLGMGMGMGALEVSVNWAVVRMSDPGDGRAMNLMHGAFAVGAVIGPLALGLIMAADLPWAWTFRGGSALFALMLLAAAFLPFKPLGNDEPSSSHAMKGMSRSPAYWLGFFVLFLYVGAELGISNWTAEYFVRIFGSSAAAGAAVVSLFWAGLLAGRLGIPFLLPRARPERLLVTLSIAFALATGLLYAAGMAGLPALPLGLVAVAAAGLGASCIYPSVMSLLGDAFPDSTAPALGFATTGGSMGAFIFPLIMSGIAGGAGLEAGFAFYAVIAVLCAALSFSLAAAVRTVAAVRGKGDAAAESPGAK
jgi:fucose permease